MKDYSWSWEYLNWGISWPLVQRILADAPKYESPKKKEEDQQSLRDKINEIKR